MKQEEVSSSQKGNEKILASPFVTTTEILKHLNKSLEQTKDPNNPLSESYFELQKRLPDGSARKATEDEKGAADLEAKLTQVAEYVQQLPDWESKSQWVEQQRSYGNQLYKASQYQQAIDVYLTCLTVAQQDESDSAPLLFCKVMNNLAQAALAMQSYHKTEQFCGLALEYLSKKKGDLFQSRAGVPWILREQLSKIFFRRGKARRLRGDYQDARADLKEAEAWIHREEDQASQGNLPLEDAQRAIAKELHLVAQSAAEGRRNRERQRNAMKRVLASKSVKEEAAATESEGAGDDQSSSHDTACSGPKHSESDLPLYPSGQRGKRTYSRLKAKKVSADDIHEEDDQPPKLSYWQWYMVMIGRVASMLLEAIGDDEEGTESSPASARKKYE